MMMLMSDNGSNMVKAIQLLKDMNTDGDCLSESDDEVTEDDDYESESAVPELPEEVRYRRMPCMAHTIQLLIKKVYVNHYGHVLEKTRFLVSKLRKSSEAVQKLVAKCGKTVVTDNSTRWNSTYYMVHRLLDVNVFANEILADMKVDSLTVAVV